MADLPEVLMKAAAVHEALDKAGLPHAFGGALALAYCVNEPRATVDVDIDVFVRPECYEAVLAALPAEVVFTSGDAELLRTDGQARGRWGRTPIDVFLSVHAFHDDVARAVRIVPVTDGISIPVVSCTHLAVFKTMFARPKDFVDIADIAEAELFDARRARQYVVELLGADADELADFDAAVANGRNPSRDLPRYRFPRG